MTHEEYEKKQKETVILRGICAAIQAMHMPNFQNLRDELSKFGWTLIRDDSYHQTNKQTKQ